MNQNLTTIQAQPWMQKSYKPLVLSDFATKAECQNMLQTVDLVQSRLCSREFAAKALLLIMELYQDKGKNPETYGAFVVNALRTFPEIIVEKMLSPRFGIVAECKFPPTVAEIVRWCEKQVEECNLARVKAEKRLLEIERRKQVSVSSPEFKSTSTADERAAIVKRALGGWYDKMGAAE